MTKHKNPEERRQEILTAAANIILEKGFSAVTMDAVAAGTSLSKGGVYRFFSNKRDVALALFGQYYREALDLNIDDALTWDLPITETFFRLIYKFKITDENAQRRDRIWLQLIPEIVSDPLFQKQRQILVDDISNQIKYLALKLLTREGVSIDADIELRIEQSIGLGVSLFEGLTIQGALGIPNKQQEILAKYFIEAFTKDILKEIESDSDKSKKVGQ